MDMTGEYVIPAPRETVWAALNDVEVLKACIPGCESITKTSDTNLEAVVSAKVGPVKAKFTGVVTLSDIDPPNGYTISGEGKGGAAGFAKGGAKVRLADAPDGGTLLTYEVNATVGGKLAQIGGRLINSTAKKMADDFFASFSETVAEEVETAEALAPLAPESIPEPGNVAAVPPPPTSPNTAGILATLVIILALLSAVGIWLWMS